jgi:hypothetical protein
MRKSPRRPSRRERLSSSRDKLIHAGLRRLGAPTDVEANITIAVRPANKAKLIARLILIGLVLWAVDEAIPYSDLINAELADHPDPSGDGTKPRRWLSGCH